MTYFHNNWGGARTTTIPIIQRRKLMPREAKWLTQGHTSSITYSMKLAHSFYHYEFEMSNDVIF